MSLNRLFILTLATTLFSSISIADTQEGAAQDRILVTIKSNHSQEIKVLVSAYSVPKQSVRSSEFFTIKSGEEVETQVALPKCESDSRWLELKLYCPQRGKILNSTYRIQGTPIKTDDGYKLAPKENDTVVHMTLEPCS